MTVVADGANDDIVDSDDPFKHIVKPLLPDCVCGQVDCPDNMRVLQMWSLRFARDYDELEYTGISIVALRALEVVEEADCLEGSDGYGEEFEDPYYVSAVELKLDSEAFGLISHTHVSGYGCRYRSILLFSVSVPLWEGMTVQVRRLSWTSRSDAYGVLWDRSSTS